MAKKIEIFIMLPNLIYNKFFTLISKRIDFFFNHGSQLLKCVNISNLSNRSNKYIYRIFITSQFSMKPINADIFSIFSNKYSKNINISSNSIAGKRNISSNSISG